MYECPMTSILLLNWWTIASHCHGLGKVTFNLILLLYRIDWTVKRETRPPPAPPLSSAVARWKKSFFLMKKERHRPQPLYLIKRDFSQTSLGGEEQPGRLMHCVHFPQTPGTDEILLFSPHIHTHKRDACSSPHPVTLCVTQGHTLCSDSGSW